jgi:hypothetical protein
MAGQSRFVAEHEKKAASGKSRAAAEWESPARECREIGGK